MARLGELINRRGEGRERKTKGGMETKEEEEEGG